MRFDFISLPKIGFGTAENEPPKGSLKIVQWYFKQIGSAHVYLSGFFSDKIIPIKQSGRKLCCRTTSVRPRSLVRNGGSVKMEA